MHATTRCDTGLSTRSVTSVTIMAICPVITELSTVNRASLP